MNGEKNLGRRHVRSLLASSSVAALLIGAGTPSALAVTVCKITVNTPSGPVTNSTSANCINIFNTTVTGNVANTGTITTGNVTLRPGATGITINSSTVTGTVTNSGTITAHNTGILIENNANVFGGVNNSATIAGGVINGGISVFNVSVFSGPVINGGLVSGGENGISIQHVATFSGGMTNTGSIAGTDIFAGTGLTVSNVSIFAGPIINGGLIQGENGILIRQVATLAGGITNTGTIRGAIVVIDSGAVSVFDSGTITGIPPNPFNHFSKSVAVDFAQNSAGNTFTLGPGYSITGAVKGQGSDTFQLGGSGNGVFDLSTVGGQYQGFSAFNVVSGTWTVSNTDGQGATWNLNGGTLAGTGTLAGLIVNNGGTLEPGTIGTPGTAMSITGDLTFQNGATYVVNLGSTTASLATAGGTATLAGAVQGVVTSGSSLSTKTTYDLLHAASVNGTFSGFSTPGFGGTLTYTPTDVLLNLTANLGGGGGGGLNPGQQNVANTINIFFNNGGTLPPDFLPIFSLTGNNLGTALSQLSGEAATGAGKGASELMTQFLDLMVDPTLAGRGGTGGAMGFAPEQEASLPPEVALAYASVLKKAPGMALKAPPPPALGWSVWGSAFGGSNTTRGDPAAGTNDVRAGDFGFAAGADDHVSLDTVVGVALAGGGTNWNLAQNLGGGRSDAFQAGAYGITHWGPAYLAADAAFANHWFTTNRTAALGDQLTASFNGQSLGARFEAGYRYGVPAAMGIAGITPYAALQTQWFHTPSYSETDLTGGGFALNFNAQDANDTRSELGARFDQATVFGGGMPLILRGRLAWAHDWVSDPALGAVFQTLPGASFTVNGAAPPKDSALTTASAELHLSRSWTATAKFDAELAPGSQTYAGTGTLRYSW